MTAKAMAGRVFPVLIAIGAAVAVGAAPAPGRPPGSATAPIQARLPVPATVLACPPPPALAQLATQAGTDAGFSGARSASATSLTGVSYRMDGPPAELTARTAPEPAAGGEPAASPASELPVAVTASVARLSASGDTATVLQATPERTPDDRLVPAPIAAMAATMTADGDLAGLAVSSCAPPATRSWLVGGGVQPGRSDRIVLTNPGQTTAVASLRVLTATGQVRPPNGQDLVVAAGHSREVLLEALIDAQPAVAVEVTSAGGALAASMIDTQVSGIIARGVEHISGAQPATETVLAPLTGDGAGVTLRLANPGTETAEVSWRILGPNGTVPSPDEAGTAVPAESVVDLPLTLPKGFTALEVSSQSPILAGATIVRERPTQSGPAADRAWIGGLAGIGSRALAVAGPGRTTLAVVGGAEASTVVVRQVDATGAPTGPEQTLAVGADALATLVLNPTTVVAQLSVRSGTVRSGLLVEAAGADPTSGALVFLAGAAVQPVPTGQPDVSVRVVREP